MNQSSQKLQWWKGIPVAAAIFYLILTLHAAKVETPTIDEFAHVPAGLVYWNYGNLHIYSKNPPLLKYWMTLPIIADSKVSIPEPMDTSLGLDWGPWIYGTSFMNANRGHYLDLFFKARIMIIILGLFTGIILYCWARDLFNSYSASIVTALFFLSPTVLAHSHLATIDIGCMFSIFLTVFTFRWAYKKPSTLRLGITGMVFALALSVKFTAILLIPVLFFLVLLHRLRPTPLGTSVFIPLLKDLTTLFLSALFFLNLTMGFQGSFKPLKQYEFRSSFARKTQAILPGVLPLPLPEVYVIGFDAQKRDTESGEFGSYLLGKWSKKGWWYYNLVAFSVKVPLPFLAMLLFAPWRWYRSKVDTKESWTILLPIITLFMTFSVFNSLNIGIRYLLPIFPFLFLLTGALFFKEPFSFRNRWTRITPIFLIVYYSITVALIHPGYLSFFNLLAGGPANGPKWLLDSNVDWGQDLYRVKEVAERRGGDKPIRLLYFGHVDPALYGIQYRLIPPNTQVKDILAVSVNFLMGYSYVIITPDGRKFPVRRDHLNWLRSKTPVEKVGSIVIFDTRE